MRGITKAQLDMLKSGEPPVSREALAFKLLDDMVTFRNKSKNCKAQLIADYLNDMYKKWTSMDSLEVRNG